MLAFKMERRYTPGKESFAYLRNFSVVVIISYSGKQTGNKSQNRKICSRYFEDLLMLPQSREFSKYKVGPRPHLLS